MILHTIAFAGQAGAGKDTAAQLLVETVMESIPTAGVVVTSFAAPIKDALTRITGVDFFHLTREDKEQPIEGLAVSPRRLMQTLGDWGRERHPEFWVRILERRLKPDERCVDDVVLLIPDVRYPNELDWVRSRGGAVWWVSRDGIAPVAAHSSENSIQPWHCDLSIANFGTKEHLAREVAQAWGGYLAQRKVA